MTNKKLGIDVMIEMIPDAQNLNRTHWRFGADAAGGVDGSRYDANGWVAVQRPAELSEDEFDRAVIHSASLVAQESFNGTRYDNDGGSNSNNFVYRTIKGAGSKPPANAAKGANGSPGLCGGKKRDTGTDCTP